MSLLTAEDFTFPYAVQYTDQEATFETFITECEAEALKGIFGRTLYNEYLVGIAVTPTPDAKWTKLRDGATYTIHDEVYTYGGLKEFLKFYVYAKWTDAKTEMDSNTGIVVNTAENSETISPALKIVRAFNKYSALVGDNCNTIDTFFGFMYVNEEADYPNWNFTAPGKMNVFNL